MLVRATTTSALVTKYSLDVFTNMNNTMQAIELETEVDENHEIHLKLPDNIGAGKARVVVMFEGELRSTKPRVFGQFRGSVKMAEDFDEPLPDAFWLGNEQ